MTATAKIDLEFLPGDDIDSACSEACRIAQLLGCRTSFTFNGVHVYARPDTDPAALVQAWETALHSKSQFRMAHA